MLGGELPVQGLDQKLVVNVPPGSRDGSVLRLAGQGMPDLRNPQRRGDLLATVVLGAPKAPTEPQRQALKASARLPVLRNGAGVLASSQQVRKAGGISLVAGGLLAMALQPGSLGAAGLLLLPALILLFVSQASRLPKLAIPAGIVGLAGLLALASQVDWQLLAFAGQAWPLLASTAGFALLIKVRNATRPAQRRPASA